MTTTHTLARVAGGTLVAAGLALGGALVTADLAFAETQSSTQSESKRKKMTHDRHVQVGLNGNLPHRPVTVIPDQFKHLPFDPAMPGGD